MTTVNKQILEEIKLIKEEITTIKENMPDKEMFLTTEEKKLLEESYANEKQGKTISGVSLRKKLGI